MRYGIGHTATGYLHGLNAAMLRAFSVTKQAEEHVVLTTFKRLRWRNVIAASIFLKYISYLRNCKAKHTSKQIFFSF